MKNLFYILILLFSISISSCTTEPVIDIIINNDINNSDNNDSVNNKSNQNNTDDNKYGVLSFGVSDIQEG